MAQGSRVNPEQATLKPSMNWYYVDNGRQAGPVDDAQLDELFRAGTVRPDTLVWREGMANWQPHNEVRQPPQLSAPPMPRSQAPAFVASANDAVCAECGNILNKNQMIRFGEVYVCANCKPIFLQKMAEGAKLNTGAYNYAGFWIRVGAKLLDSVILTVIIAVPAIIFWITSRNSDAVPIIISIFQIGFVVLSLPFQIFFLGKYGATPGKMLCKIKVITADGGKISYARATGRVFAEMLSGLICDIGYIIAAFDKEKRALHDHICNTRVIHK